MRMIFLDANVLLAYDNESDVHHLKAVQLFQEIAAGVFGEPLTSDYVFNEIVGITFRKRGKTPAATMGERILNSIFILNIDDHLFKEAWQIFTKTNLTFNFVDCTNLVATRLAQAEYIATFDKEFKYVPGITIIDGTG